MASLVGSMTFPDGLPLALPLTVPPSGSLPSFSVPPGGKLTEPSALTENFWASASLTAASSFRFASVKEAASALREVVARPHSTCV